MPTTTMPRCTVEFCKMQRNFILTAGLQIKRENVAQSVLRMELMNLNIFTQNTIKNEYRHKRFCYL